MNNKKIIGIFLIVFFITIAAVSATENTTTTTSTNTSISEQTQDIQTPTNDIKTEKNITSKFNIGVKYQYEEDNKINPSISAKTNNKNNNNTNLSSSKTYDKNLNIYTVSVNHSENVKTFNLTLSAPGYEDQTKTFKVNQTQGIIFNLKATESYQYGRDLVSIADKKLNFSRADDILVITSAGVPKYKNQTSEDVMEAIINYCNGTVSNGKGNMLMLRQTANDPIDTCFVVKNGRNMTAMVFLNASTKYSYLGTISENMTRKQWNTYYKAVGGEDAYSFASLANGWNANVSYLVLQEAAFHGHICEGTLGGYTITEALLQYYPPIKETAPAGANPGDKTSYKILGIPGDSANDAVLFFLDATAGKSGYVGFNTTSTGATSNMMGFIRWNPGTIVYNNKTNSYEEGEPSSGTIILMKYNSEENKKLFTKETGIKLTGTLEELKYNTWWINKINTNPAGLVSIILEKDNLTEEQYYYLIGLADDITYPTTVVNATNAGQVRIKSIEAHGLDYKYITSLNLPNATRNDTIATRGNLTYNDFKNIGVEAGLIAKKYFKEELGVDLQKDMPNFEVLTTAGYTFLNQQSTEAVWDGLYEEFGVRLTRQTLLPNHRPMWKPLWFTFVLKQDDGKLMALYVRYNENNNTFFVSDYEGSHINNINIEALNNSNMSSISSVAFPDGNWFNIQSLTNAWANDLAFDQFCTFLFHGHACPGVQPGFFMSDYILSNYPLSENESYFYIASSIYCKDDSIEYLLGISPGLGSYMDQKLASSDVESEYVNGATEEGVLVVWDNELNVGRAVIMNFKWATIDTSKYATPEAKRAAQIRAYVSLYKGEPNEDVVEGNTILATEEKWITADEYAKLKAGADDNDNALSFIRKIDDRTREEAIKLTSSDKQINTNYNSSAYETNNSGNLINNGGSHSSNNNNNLVATNSSTYKSSSSSNNNAQQQGSDNSEATVMPGTTIATTATVGVAEASADAANEAKSGDSKAYEVSESGDSSSNNINNIVYFIVALGILGALSGYGYIRSKR
ncbi:FmdE family protein [Methanosphaera cuniculi]|uniref:FmdE family protein n=1 Tax=Methanosphaera cuniculi TaxID=1077256 RepID=UPI0026E93F21|nr:FmdE family protein [Methanosphaera cuniculi]